MERTIMSVHPSGKDKHLIPRAAPVKLPERTAAKTLKSAEFLAACGEAAVKPTKRQAARYNRGDGRWAKSR